MHPDTGTTNRELPALFVAVKTCNYAIAQQLILHGAEVNYPTSSNDSCRSVIFVAVVYGNAEMITLLAAHGGDFDSKRQAMVYERTPLHEAVWFGHANVVMVLLELGVRVDERDNNFQTPLEIAERQACGDGAEECMWELMVQIAELLVGAGAHVPQTEEGLIGLGVRSCDQRKIQFRKIMITAKQRASLRA